MRLIRANIEIDVENAATAEKLMKSGFEPLEGVTKVATSDPDKTKKNLDEMTVEESYCKGERSVGSISSC